MQWDKITNIILITALITLGIFVILGLCQWISRKSLKKVDKELLWLPLPLALMAITYVIFDKFLILNTRPDGSGEPSFPSTHVMVVTTIFLLTAIVLPKYIKSKIACLVLYLFMLAFVVLNGVGRVLANKHWTSDVLGAIGFSLIFALIYFLIYQLIIKKKEKHA